MSNTSPLSAEILAFRTCAVCYKTETKKVKFRRCGNCMKPAYCSVECQKKAWKSHKETCQFQAENRESLPARGTQERDMLSNIKKWFSKHTQLLVYAGTHAMGLDNRVRAGSMLATHMLVLILDPAPSGIHGDFIYKSAALRGMQEYGLDDTTCAALAKRVSEAAKDNRHSLTTYVRCGAAVYLAPITVERLNSQEHVLRFGPPDSDWERFLGRAINKNLEEGDRKRIERLQQLA
ncbi:hypothetical protein C8F04DRAFT_384165 [Mycena alexandri]|uniref:MYND-type domain-containing protein n=1 Tax=Mycena alexandri TaxID=1745969 RepID=A0AAD6T2A3_9AGAR|nr:hypothetical protein C8F04DRAFT_384165 [Mycena alexandri]